MTLEQISATLKRAHRKNVAVRTVEDHGIVRIYHGHNLIRELLLGPRGTYHGNGKKPTGRPPKTKIA